MRPDALFAGRYRLERRLGVGGMATVQLAFDTRLERYVAVKLLAEHLAEDANFVSRFRREALAAARLVHPNIVQVFDFGLDESHAPQLHRHGVRRRPVVRRDAARAGHAAARRGRRDPRPGLPRARLRAPQRRRAPRRQARQPPAQPRGDGQARRLRHRQGGRRLRHHAGRLGDRHRRLPGARAGARRARRPAVGPLRARRRRLPAARRPPALPGRLADRPRAPAGDRPAAAARRGRPRRPAALAAAVARALHRDPEHRYADAAEMETRAARRPARPRAGRPTEATWAAEDTAATRMLDRHGRHAALARPARRRRAAPPLEPLDRAGAAPRRRPAGAVAAPRAGARAAPERGSGCSSACSWCSPLAAAGIVRLHGARQQPRSKSGSCARTSAATCDSASTSSAG